MATPSCEAKRQARRMRSASSGKARRRVSHAAQDAALHVGHAAEGIDDPARRVVSQGVYGEVAPFQIFLNGGGLGHGVRVAPIAVGAVGAVGGDLQRLAVAHYRERAMGDAGLHGAPAGITKGLLHRGPGQARRDIHIVDGPPEQSVANEAAHAPCRPLASSMISRASWAARGRGSAWGRSSRIASPGANLFSRPARTATVSSGFVAVVKAAMRRWRSDKDAVMCWGCGERQS